MKRILAILMVAIATAAPAATIIFSTQQLSGNINNRPIELSLDGDVIISGTNLIYGRTIVVQPVLGVVVTNLVAAPWIVSLDGKKLKMTVPAGTGTYSAATLIESGATYASADPPFVTKITSSDGSVQLSPAGGKGVVDLIVVGGGGGGGGGGSVSNTGTYTWSAPQTFAEATVSNLNVPQTLTLSGGLNVTTITATEPMQLAGGLTVVTLVISNFAGDISGGTNLLRTGVSGLEAALDFLTNRITIGGAATNAIANYMGSGTNAAFYGTLTVFGPLNSSNVINAVGFNGSFFGDASGCEFDASKAISGLLPLARLSGITSNQIASATDDAYRNPLTGQGITNAAAYQAQLATNAFLTGAAMTNAAAYQAQLATNALAKGITNAFHVKGAAYDSFNAATFYDTVWYQANTFLNGSTNFISGDTFLAGLTHISGIAYLDDGPFGVSGVQMTGTNRFKFFGDLELPTTTYASFLLFSEGAIQLFDNGTDLRVQDGGINVDGTVTGSGFTAGVDAGITTNINVIVPGNKTNQMQFKGGILTGVIPYF